MVEQSEQRKVKGLEAVLARIQSMEDEGWAWSLSAGELRELLGLANTDFYREVYAAECSGHPLVSLASATGRFSQENIWEFVALVELFCGSETEHRLEEAGIFFSHSEQLEMMSTLIKHASETVRRHRLREEEFSAMLRTFGSFERAREVYLEEYISLDNIMEQAAWDYCAGRSFRIPALARTNVLWLYRFLFQKHVLDPEALFAGLNAPLFSQAVREGYSEEMAGGGEEAGRTDSQRPDGDSARQQAARLMGLDGRPLSLSLLKSQYKKLMKCYHPDLNPRGLQRCQEINAAYSLLLSSL